MQLAQKSKLNSMLDHAPRIRAQQQQAAEQATIDELERRAAPLQWAVLLAVVAVTLGAAVDAWGPIAARIADQAAQAEVLARCMNGQAFSVGGDEILRCQIIKYNLVEGLKS